MKILSVDDHVVVREGIRRIFASVPDTDVYGAGTSEEAISAFRTLKPEIVILDISISGVSGFILLERFKAENPNTKVLMLSMHSDTAYAARAFDAGAHGYVTKAISAEELLVAVESVAKGNCYIESEIAMALALVAIGRSEFGDQR